MGQKSRSKRQQKPQNKQSVKARPVEQQGFVPDSLKGLVSQPAVSNAGPHAKKRTLSVFDIEELYVRSDVRRVLLLLIVSLAVLGLFFAIDRSTSYFQQAGEAMGSWLKL